MARKTSYLIFIVVHRVAIADVKALPNWLPGREHEGSVNERHANSQLQRNFGRNGAVIVVANVIVHNFEYEVVLSQVVGCVQTSLEACPKGWHPKDF